MNITDFDDLSAEEYDRKHKAEIKKVKDKQPKYSKNDMISFAREVLIDAHISGKSMEKTFLDWERAH